MSVHRKNNFLTLVLTLLLSIIVNYSNDSLAAPNSEYEVQKISPSSDQNKKTDKSDINLTESTQITPAENLEFNQNDPPLLPTRTVAPESNIIGLGLGMGSLINNSNSNNIFLLKIGKTFHEDLFKGYEYDFSLTMDGFIGWDYGYKWIQWLNKWYEPYLKVDIGALYLPSENLGTFINWNRYHIMGAIGLDDLLRKKHHLRTELGIAWSGNGLSYLFNFSVAY